MKENEKAAALLEKIFENHAEKSKKLIKRSFGTSSVCGIIGGVITAVVFLMEEEFGACFIALLSGLLSPGMFYCLCSIPYAIMEIDENTEKTKSALNEISTFLSNENNVIETDELPEI